MAARDKNGRAFVVGRRVRVTSSGKPHPGGSNPAGDYEGEIVGLHEDGPHVLNDKGERSTPFADECEVLGTD